MAHFAKLDKNNIVVFVTIGRDEDAGKEEELTARTGDVYKQTSYNTRGGIYYLPNSDTPGDQSKAFRKNYAGIGFFYDKERDAFIPPKPVKYPSWILNEQSCLWNPPIPYPQDGEDYFWDETSQLWIKVHQ